MRGSVGSNCNTIIYTRKLKKTTKNCRNCKYLKSNEFTNKTYCNKFKMSVTDCNNAKVCKEYHNKH